MRWSCPHCKTQLDAADDEISANWSFALCAHCRRFGLIRKSSQLAVKVDRAPAGEKFIRGTITGPAPVIRPAQPRRQESTQTIVRAQPVTIAKERKVLAPRLPEPLPDVPERHRFSFAKLLFFGCVGILAWNGYRYQRITTTDTIAAEAMAPQRIDVGSEIQPRTLNAQIRNNPGHQFPVIGALDPSVRYSVLEVRSQTDGQWYRIDNGTKSGAWVSIQDVSPAH